MNHEIPHLGDLSAIQVQVDVGVDRDGVDTSSGIVDQTMEMLSEMPEGIVHQEFVPSPGDACERCDTKLISPHSADADTVPRRKRRRRTRKGRES